MRLQFGSTFKSDAAFIQPPEIICEALREFT